MITLIVPCAGKSSRFPNIKPKWLFTHPDGKIMIQKSIDPFLKNKMIKKKIITITKEIDKKFNAKFLLKQMFGKKVKILILKNQTASASETVFNTIEKFKIKNQILVKDSDNSFKIDPKFNILKKNFIVFLNISKNPEISNIHQKSFIELNNKKQIINIEEKKIISDKICVGLYSFQSANDFKKHYKNCRNKIKNSEIFVSLVVKNMLNENNLFTCIEAKKYEDYGTFEDWLNIRKKYRTFFVDLDGVVFLNKGKYGKKNWNTKNQTIENNVNSLLELSKDRTQIVFTSSRPEKNKKKIDKELKKLGFKNFKLVLGLNHTQRIIVNDYSDSNPNPSAISINMERDASNLSTLIKSI
jgi:hypothetical protein